MDVDFLREIIPTAENLAVKFWNILEPKIPAGKLYSIKLAESGNNIVDTSRFNAMNNKEYLDEKIALKQMRTSIS